MKFLKISKMVLVTHIFKVNFPMKSAFFWCLLYALGTQKKVYLQSKDISMYTNTMYIQDKSQVT